MTAIEIKTEIEKVINEIPEESLSEILSLIKKFQISHTKTSKSDANFEKIMNKHAEVLSKLAQ